jgi:penicillin-binding protein 1C
MNTQLKLEKLVADYVQESRLQKNINNAAVVVINNQTHQVISYLGPRFQRYIGWKSG